MSQCAVCIGVRVTYECRDRSQGTRDGKRRLRAKIGSPKGAWERFVSHGYGLVMCKPVPVVIDTRTRDPYGSAVPLLWPNGGKKNQTYHSFELSRTGCIPF